MKKLLLVALVLLAGCSTARDYATLALYRAERKVLLFARTPCSAANKPAMVSEWVREKDIGRMVVLCDVECNCRLTKKTPKMKMVTAPSEGICQ